MFYVLGRTRKTLEELRQHLFVSPMKVDSFTMKEGNYLDIQEVDTDNSK